MTILASDTFAGRTVSSNSWGIASDGNTWAKLHGTSVTTVLSVSSNEGRAHGGFTDCQNLLGSGTATDQEGLCRMALGQNGDSIGVILRSNATGTNYYYSETGISPGAITIYKVVSGTKTLINIWAQGFTPAVGSFFWIRFQVIGTTLKTRIWADDGSSEPGTWTGTDTDSTIASGQYGIFLNSGGATDAQFDSYQANDTGSGGTPSPMASVIVRGRWHKGGTLF